ncbi:WD40 repeat domain-containing protein [Streptomyces sp. NPDC050788]|jgi:WD40 repeat protein|uniref:WD40 repeat domain-containing protein n=1 Tax=Streptomyces sp. NPDC050788 TaxID=3155041 RepID=UPI003442D78E
MRELVALETAAFFSGFGHVVMPVLGTGPDGRPLLCSFGPDGSEVARWDFHTGKRLWCYDEGMSGCNDGVFVRRRDGGVSLAVATEDGIEWWDALTGEYRPELTWEEATIWDLGVGKQPDGRPVLLGACHDGGIYRWDGETGESLGTPLRGHRVMMAVSFVSLTGNAGVIVAGDDAGRIWRWDSLNGEPIGEPLVGDASQIRMIEALPANGNPLIVSRDQDSNLQLWDVITGMPVGQVINTGTDVHGLAVTELDGVAVLIAAGADETVRVWDAGTGQPIQLSGQGVVVHAVDAPDGGALLAVCTSRGEVVVTRYAFHPSRF